MRTALFLAVLALPLQGCLPFTEPDDDQKVEADLKAAYRDCLQRNAGNEARCTQEKDRLQRRQQWDMMDESG